MERSVRSQVILAIIILSTTLSVQDASAQAGKSGLAFLKLGGSARGVSMGDAMSGSVTGAAATYYNPAGLLGANADGSSAEVMLMHKGWIQDTRMEYLATRIALNDESALGFFLNSTTVSDIEVRTRPGTPEGTFTARNFSVGASYARTMWNDLRIGLTAKFLYEKIFVDEASGLAFDLGLQCKTPIEHLSVGAVLANLGSVSELRSEKSTLPAILRVGPAYSLEIESMDSRIILAADELYIFPERSSYLNVGGELFFNQTLAARAGYQFGSEGRGLSTGVGVHYGIVNLDYAYSPFSSDLGNAHTISLGLNF
jgi:hypothetical protein